MDSKNVIAAIALSTAVIVLYSLFFIPEKSTVNKNLAEKNKIEQNTDTPTLDQKETVVQISREEALKQNEAYLLKSGKIEMIRGQMRLMTDRMTFEKSAVTPLADEVNERRDVCEAKDCGELDLSALFFDRIQ